MSYLSDASLVMIPSGYKDGKLYSVKPTNGNGDFTFSRGSNLAATRVNSEGLIEKGRENLLLQSNTFDTTWTTSNASVTGGQSGYDGSNDAWKIESTNTGQSRLTQTISISGVTTVSFYAKEGTANYIILYIISSGDPRVWFNLSTGVVETTASNIDATIEDVGSGWYRCSMTLERVSSTLWVFIGNTDNNFNSAIGDNIYIQDAQLEVGLVATEYIETTTTTAQAGILEDMPRLDYSGGSCPALLLEPQRSNLNNQSEYFATGYFFTNGSITTNNATSPEGVNNASSFIENTATGTHQMRKTQSVTSGNDYTFSFYAKSNGRDYVNFWEDVITGNKAYFNLSNGTATNSGFTSVGIESAGNGWYRCFGTKSSFSGSSFGLRIHASQGANFDSYIGDGESGFHLYGLQLEQGSYPTSYIPTYGSSVTRSAEDMLTSSTALNGGQTGSIFVDFERLAIDTSWAGAMTQIVTSGGSEEIRLHFDAPTPQVRWRDANNSYVDIGGAISTTINARTKTILTSDGTTIKVFANGSKVGSDYTIVNPLDFDRIVNLQRGSLKINSEIYFPTALSDAECIALTTL
jgi:hypothetical protein